jgi:hypothetical protein
MRAFKTSHGVDQGRRHFLLGAAVMTTVAQFGIMAAANAQTGEARPTRPGTNLSLGPLKQIDAGALDVGYAEVGPARRPSRTWGWYGSGWPIAGNGMKSWWS